ncbi:MAG TPA: glycosyltransferase family 4 protein [archaeon]|nr:glycosyltransferase family 4 protein [archaeon]
MKILMAKFGRGTGIVSGADVVPLQYFDALPKYNGHDPLHLVTGLNFYSEAPEAKRGDGLPRYVTISKNGHGESYAQSDDPAEIVSLAVSQSPDIFHTHTRAGILGDIARKIKKRGGTVVHTMHGMDELKCRYAHEMFDNADLILTPSEYSADAIRALEHGKYAGKTWAFPNFTTMSDWRNDPEVKSRAKGIRDQYSQNGEKLILTTGRMNPDKGIYELAEAVAIMARNGENVKLLHAGMIFSGDAMQQFEEIFTRYGVQGNYALLGQIDPMADPKELPAIYQASHVFILPSDTTNETFGLAPLEALSQGTPIVVSNVGGTKEVYVDSKLAIGVAPRNVKSIINAAKEVLGNEDRERHRASIGAEVVKTIYHPDFLIPRLQAAYERIHERPVVPDMPTIGGQMPSAITELDKHLNR